MESKNFLEVYGYLTGIFGEDGDLIYQRIIEMLGPGRRVTILSYEKLLILQRNEQIRQESKGCNHEELAIKYGVTERTIRRILR